VSVAVKMHQSASMQICRYVCPLLPGFKANSPDEAPLEKANRESVMGLGSTLTPFLSFSIHFNSYKGIDKTARRQLGPPPLATDRKYSSKTSIVPFLQWRGGQKVTAVVST